MRNTYNSHARTGTALQEPLLYNNNKKKTDLLPKDFDYKITLAMLFMLSIIQTTSISDSM